MKISDFFGIKPSIAYRLTWRVILSMTLILTFILTFIFFIVGLMGTGSINYINQLGMMVSNEQINNVFSAVEIAVTNNVPEAEDNIGNDKRAYFAQENLLALNPSIVGCAIAYNPDCEPKKGELYAPYVFHDSTGIHCKQLNSKEYDYLHQDWYTTPLKTGKDGWSEPYIDKGGGGIPMITYSLPLYNSSGEIYAVQTADIALDRLKEISNEMDSIFIDNFRPIIEKEIHAYNFIVTNKGTFVAHPDKNLVLKATLYDFLKNADTNHPEELARRILSGEKGRLLFKQKQGSNFLIYYSPIGHTEWTMGVVIPVKEIATPVVIVLGITLLLMLLGLILVALMCIIIIHRITKPITRFANSADEIAQGHFDAELPEIKSKDEMRRLRDSFQMMQVSLVKHIEETKKVNEEKGRIAGELHIARGIQLSMLPKTFPPYPERDDIDIFGQQTPAKEVGGDLYDFYIRDEKLFFCIGDVSGKGVPASLVMGITRTLFRTISDQESLPDLIMSTINNAIANDNESNMFVTLFIGVLDLPTGRLRYCNGGHNAPLTIKDGQVTPLPCEPNLPIGVLADWKFKMQETTIIPQTTIFLYTDGLTEAENSLHEQFQDERVVETICKAPNRPQAIIEQMTEEVQHFVGQAEQSDDITMLAVQYTYERNNSVILNRQITLHNDIEEVPQLAAFVEEICETVGYDISTTMSINLAMEEAVVNVMNYAYPVGVKGLVQIEATANEKRLKFVIIDWGKPFDPTAKKEVDVTLSAEDRPIGGLGIHLVRKIMDTINYERLDDKNVLSLRKKLV